MKKVLFIDRDGTILLEPPTDYQVDSFEKFSFYPKVIRNLYRIFTELDYEFVMVTNQDGLGTSSYPEDTFWPYQDKMMEILEGEGIQFAEVFIDGSFEHQNSPNRKPRLGMLGQYLTGEYDLANSYVIGDRLTDVQLAKNLGAKSILLQKEAHEAATFTHTDWDEIYHFLRLPARKATIQRNTNETQIRVEINLDGEGKSDMQTGLGFFDHMLDQLARHSGVDMRIQVKGDLHIDEHHTIEDTALALGEAFAQAIGDKRGISRYGFLLPMDDALVHAAIDFSGRPWLVWDAKFSREKIGDMPTEMFMHFFKSFSDTSKSNLNIKAEGENEHHKIEAIFKAVAKAIKMALVRDVNKMEIPSTKGIL
ncbi:bifunctional histidinol-phosphatase/imidazoleglycerol-phosphate dehydratase HisB [Rufibacter sp. XAAS-G3-1]|uniref:bifunctional histidinol-phosphatase/imidazoleglycerol-phosphate dehydratase HisB n=1 Tax=Rufibacter sp. XAAS-G3-1 TaxID=2729134 RepID=UPI0015E64203|nr:bifunctional histidinol-phosphatase/imidazoleglycerol-phosphate dehydratase HisB [Rufibacter sp. XAAS-G3-1]